MRDQASISAITVWAPWAQLIATGGKDVENRPWPVPGSLVGEWVAIHVGKNHKEWKELRAKVLADDEGDVPDEVWNGLLTHYGAADASGAQTPPDAGHIIALAYIRGTINDKGIVNGHADDGGLTNALNSPWLTVSGFGHVYGPVIPLPRTVIDAIGDVSGLQKYWAVPFPVASKLREFFDVFTAAIEERRTGTALAVVAEPCDDGEDGSEPEAEAQADDAAPDTDVAIDGDGVVQDDDDDAEARSVAARYADPPEPGEADHGGIIGRYWCGETSVGATAVIGVGLWRVLFSAKQRPDGCHMGTPDAGELVQRKRKNDDASRHVDVYLVPKSWCSGSRGYSDLEAGRIKEGDQGIVRLGMAEILSEQATASSDGNSELWRWTVVAKSTQGWVDVLLARGKLQLAFYLVQREIETSKSTPEPEPAPKPAPPPVAQQQLFPDPPPAAEPEVEPAPSGALQLGYTPELADVVDAELVEIDPVYGTAMLIARCLEGNGGQMAMPFGWLLKALRQYCGAVGVDVERVIDALLAHPTMFDCNNEGRSIQSVRLIGSLADLQANVPAGAFHWVTPTDGDAELLKAHLMRRAGRETVGNCRIFGTGPLRMWTDARILTIARSSSDWFTVDGATVGLRYPDQAALDDICRKAFSDQAAEWLPTGTLTEVFARALKVNQPEAAAWVQRALAESLCLRKRDKGFGYVWVEAANAAG